MCEQPMQRSELQLHTVMSADTSVLTVRQALETAVILGYKALAITDRNSVQSFYSAALYYQQLHTALKLIYGAELANSDGCYTVLVKDAEGLKALYRLISGNEITPREREHLLFGSGNHNGALYGAVANGLNREELIQLAGEYDYIELYVGQGGYTHQEINKKLYALGEKLSIPVVAVGGCHYATADDAICKEVVDSLNSTRLHTPREDLSMRTTEEMLEAFSYLGEEAAYQVVVTNSNMLADKIEQIDVEKWNTLAFTLPDGAQRVNAICTQRLQQLYGENPPKEITDRLQTELSLLGDVASLYLLTYDLAAHIRSLGGLVGCRGYMGSTLIAYLLQISDVNPLPAHYHCPLCGYTEFVQEDSGLDLPEKACSHCGGAMVGDGNNIPYETGMGVSGDKVPTLDINIAPSLQGEAVSFLVEHLGKDRLAYAGNVPTLMNRLAESYVQVYCHQSGEKLADPKPIVEKLSQLKKGEGVQPFGIVLLPEGMQWEDVTPLRTLDKPVHGINKATHMEYYQVQYALPKISILGNSMMERLQKLMAVTAVEPEEIAFNDPAVYDLFYHLDTCGISEYSGAFCKDILCELGPIGFTDLVCVCGMAHGTNSWRDNGENLIREGHSIRELISTRDDVFQTLQSYGVDRSTAYMVMETVRKGRFRMDTPKNDFMTKSLEDVGVPQWYIRSMKTIYYLFPKAHAAHYAKLSVALAWFKVHYPEAFYNVTLKELGAEQYIDRDDEHLEWLLEGISKTDYAVARQREAIELLIEARTKNIPIHL